MGSLAQGCNSDARRFLLRKLSRSLATEIEGLGPKEFEKCRVHEVDGPLLRKECLCFVDPGVLGDVRGYVAVVDAVGNSCY